MATPKLIGLCGRAGSGKDTVAELLYIRGRFARYAMAKPLKDALAAMGIFEPARDKKELPLPGRPFSYRQAAQTLGTEWARNLDPDFWINLAERNVTRYLKENTPVVITDIRFENEEKFVRKHGGVIWQIVGRSAELGDAAGHVSEQYKPTPDLIIDNSSTLKQLELMVQQILEK